MAETATDYGELKVDMILPSLEVFQQMSIARVGQDGLFEISDKRTHLEEYEDDEDVEYHLILCAHCDDDDYLCNAATSARDLGDGTGKVIVVGTDFIHSNLCISRQVRLQQQQVQKLETTRPPEGAEDAGRVENGDSDLVMTVEDHGQTPSCAQQPDPPLHETSQNPASLASAILPEAPSNSSEGVLSWLQNQSLEKAVTVASSASELQHKQKAALEEYRGVDTEPSKTAREAASEEAARAGDAARTVVDMNNATSAASLSTQPAFKEAARTVGHYSITAYLTSRSTPEEAASMNVDVTNTYTAPNQPPQTSLNAHVPAVGTASTTTTLQHGQSPHTREAGFSSVGPSRSDVILSVDVTYKTVDDAERAIHAWHANAYPDRSEAHGMTKITGGRFRSSSVCKLRRGLRIKECPARIHFIRSKEDNLLHIAKVNLQHSAACNAYVSAAGAGTISPRTDDGAHLVDASGSTSDASMLIEGAAVTDSRETSSKFAGREPESNLLQPKPSISKDKSKTAGVEVVLQQALEVESVMLNSARKEPAMGNKLLFTDGSATNDAQLNRTLPSSRQPSASSTSTLPEGRSRPMARRGGRPARSSRPKPQEEKPSVDYTKYAGNTSVRAAINASKAAMKKTESPVLPSESSSSESEASSSSSETASASSAEESESDSEKKQLPADEIFKRGARFPDYEAVETALQLWHLRVYNDSTNTRFLLRRRAAKNKPSASCRLREKRSLTCPFHILFHPRENGYTVAKSNVVHSAACDRQVQQESTDYTSTNRNHTRENSLVSQASGDGRVVAKLPNRKRSLSGKYTLDEPSQTFVSRTSDQSHRKKRAAPPSKALEKASNVDNDVESSGESDPGIEEDSASESSSDEDGATAAKEAETHSTRNARDSSSVSGPDSESDSQALHARPSKSKLICSSSDGRNSLNRDRGSIDVGDHTSMRKDENIGRSKHKPTGSASSSNSATIDDDTNHMQVDKESLRQVCKEESQAPARIDETAHGTEPVGAEFEPELSSEEEQILLARKIPFRESGWPEDMVERFEAHHLYTPQSLLDAGVTQGIEEIWEFVRDEEPFDTYLKGHPTKVELHLVKKHMSIEWRRIEACLAAQNDVIQ